MSGTEQHSNSQTAAKPSRRDSILQTLAEMLESNPGQRITTAALAREVGVSEAALYRHFASKAKMFEALIEFVEDTLFSRISQIISDETELVRRCELIVGLVLNFAARNPGLCRLLTGDALTGENERLRKRCSQVFERLETQLKQLFREAELQQGLATKAPAAATANLILAWVEGRIIQFVRSGFTRSPAENWEVQWRLLSASMVSEERYAGMV